MRDSTIPNPSQFFFFYLLQRRAASASACFEAAAKVCHSPERSLWKARKAECRGSANPDGETNFTNGKVAGNILGQTKNQAAFSFFFWPFVWERVTNLYPPLVTTNLWGRGSNKGVNSSFLPVLGTEVFWFCQVLGLRRHQESNGDQRSLNVVRT